MFKSSQLSRASVTCFLGVLRSSSQLSRASVTCLLGFEQGAEVVKGVGDVLAGRVEELFAVVKGR